MCSVDAEIANCFWVHDVIGQHCVNVLQFCCVLYFAEMSNTMEWNQHHNLHGDCQGIVYVCKKKNLSYAWGNDSGGCCVCRNQKFVYTCLKDDTMDAREREFDSFSWSESGKHMGCAHFILWSRKDLQVSWGFSKCCISLVGCHVHFIGHCGVMGVLWLSMVLLALCCVLKKYHPGGVSSNYKELLP